MSKPVDVGSLKTGHYVVIDDEPCRIVEYEKSKPGKHGSAKARIVGIGVFTNSKRTLLSPVDARIEVPIIQKKTGQVISLSGDVLQIMDLESYQTFDTPMPPEDEIRAKLAAGQEVEYWSVMGKNKIVRVKG